MEEKMVEMIMQIRERENKMVEAIPLLKAWVIFELH